MTTRLPPAPGSPDAHGSPDPLDARGTSDRGRPDAAATDIDDLALRAALRALPPDLDPPPADLQARVLAQWRAQGAASRARAGVHVHELAEPILVTGGPAGGRDGAPGGSSMGASMGASGGWPGGGSHGHGRRWVLGLAALAVVALLWWWQRPDPVLEELMRIDVLSQIAAGEM